MRIHANTITADDIREAAEYAGVTLERCTEHGSRSRARAFDVILNGSGREGGQWGTGTGKSAVWDEWGIFLSMLWARDDSVTVPRVYVDRESFQWSTGHRYDGLRREGIHANHKWNFDGHSAAGSYSVQSCKCGAIRRWRTITKLAGYAPGGDAENALGL